MKLKDKQRSLMPSDDELAKQWISRYSNTIHGLGCFRRYKEGTWIQISLTQVKQEILEILIEGKSKGIRPTTSRLNSVVEISRILATISSDNFDLKPNIIVFKNGSFDVKKGILLPHAMENYAISSISYDYDPSATPRTWLSILSRLPPEAVTHLQEYFGYCLTRETKYESAIWLTGPSGSGKSAIIAGIQTMAGPLAAQLSISDIERSKFTLPLIVGKHIVYSTEQYTVSPTSIDNLNKIVSGEKLLIEEKYKDPFEYIPYAKIIWASTEIPAIASSDGFHRRFKIITLPSIPPNERNIDIKGLIKQEGPGIFNWALEGLWRLWTQGRFSNPIDIIATPNQSQEVNQIVQRFIEACCDKKSDYKTQSSYLYNAYKTWCFANNYLPKSIKKIAEDWRLQGFTQKNVNGRSYWIGIKLKSDSGNDCLVDLTPAISNPSRQVIQERR